ncbi:hypothetical protein GM51_3140 [freshwater metagenome]|uniref:Uncharacterized protein n=1 Tax=freshwater metagenome TaxID=449393 RepID=A0A094R2L1_9ZZZZ
MRKFLVVSTVILVSVIALLGYALFSDSPTNSRPLITPKLSSGRSAMANLNAQSLRRPLITLIQKMATLVFQLLEKCHLAHISAL